MLALSSLLLTSLFVALLVLQGRGLATSQLQGLVLAAVMSLLLTVLVFRAKGFPEAARWYIAALGIAVVGSVAAAVVSERLGDVVGLLGCVAAALVCASRCVANLRSAGPDDAVISPKSVEALQLLTAKLKADVSQTLSALADASETSEPYLLERLRQLRVEAAHADAWSRRMRLPGTHPARKSVASLQRRLSA